MSLIAVTLAKPVFLMILACSATECPEEIRPQSWSGPEAMNECQAYIRSDDFDPSDYMELGGDETHYQVGCR